MRIDFAYHFWVCLFWSKHSAAGHLRSIDRLFREARQKPASRGNWSFIVPAMTTALKSNRRRLPFQTWVNLNLQLLTGLRETAKYLQIRGRRSIMGWNHGLVSVSNSRRREWEIFY
jgi:hypothetical protein